MLGASIRVDVPKRSKARAWWLVFLLFAQAITAHALSGYVKKVSFMGPVTSNLVTFSLYLPPGYDTSTNHYPLIIHLHGIGGTHDGAQTNLVPQSHEASVAAGLIEPCLIAFPDGYGDSFWADSVNSEKPAETNIRSEIIPYLDANYRTVPGRERRVIQGFSMGGFGAAKFAAKFPDLFCACVIYDGALLSWAQIQQRHPTQAAEIFNNDSETFNQSSPWYWLTQNADGLRARMRFRDSVGSLLNENRAWRDALQGELVPSEYVETGLTHSLGPLLTAEGSNSWRFIASAFREDGTNSFRLQIIRTNGDLSVSWPSQPGEYFQIEDRTNLQVAASWRILSTNWPAAPGTETLYVHTNGLVNSTHFYRVARIGNSTPPGFTFDWDGTNFVYSDAQRTFGGIMLKPAGEGPFPALVINHGAGGTTTGYSLSKAREMSAWGLVCMGPMLTHVAGGETNPANMGNCAENIARATACLNVLSSLGYIETNRLALFGHSMGAFAAIGQAAEPGGRIRAAAITAGGVIPDGAGTNNAAPTVTEATPVQVPFLMLHCDADPIVPAIRSQTFQQLLNTNGVLNQRILISSDAIPNTNHWHNIHQDPNINAIVLTNTYQWLQNHGVLP